MSDSEVGDEEKLTDVEELCASFGDVVEDDEEEGEEDEPSES